MWAYKSVFYQIYPLGFSEVPFENDGVQRHGIRKVIDWIPHIKRIGCNAIYFSPVFESDTHGYNTRDYTKIDVRLGSNEDFTQVCTEIHNAGLKVVLDGVFNHVGRGHFAFQDVIKNREHSQYLHWFSIDLNGDSNYQDGLWYEGWEGNYDLVKLNLQNEQVIQYLLDAVGYWMDTWEIDGIRLDVAYCLDENFMRRLRAYTESRNQEFFLLGEMVHGDYSKLVNQEMLHSATNYECYKGMYSALNSMNLFEIIHSLIREFGNPQGGIYQGMHLLSFVDNHDVSRIASVIQREKHLPLVYALCFSIPGIPIIYYGSEWGALGEKSQGDQALRPCFQEYQENELSTYIGKLAEIKKSSNSLNYGDFQSHILTNRQCVFSRGTGEERMYIAMNADEVSYTVAIPTDKNQIRDLMTNKEYQVSEGLVMEPFTAYFLQ